MKPVEQTRFGLDGNCFAACLASILETPIESIPDPFDERLGDARQWRAKWDAWRAWLAPRNLTLLEYDDQGSHPKGYAIMGVISHRVHPHEPSKKLLHAVVALDGACVWDPHPGRGGGFGRTIDWTVFTVLDPTQPVIP